MYGRPSKPSWMDIGYDNLSFAEKTREYNRDLMLYEIANKNNTYENNYNHYSYANTIPSFSKEESIQFNLKFILSTTKQEIMTSFKAIVVCLILISAIFCYTNSIQYDSLKYEILQPFATFGYYVLILCIIIFSLIMIYNFILSLIIPIKLKAFEKANKK